MLLYCDDKYSGTMSNEVRASQLAQAWERVVLEAGIRELPFLTMSNVAQSNR